MIRPLVLLQSLALSLTVFSVGASAQVSLTVKAGSRDRSLTPIRFELAEDRLSPSVREAMATGPVALEIRAIGSGPVSSLAQVDRLPDRSKVSVSWILPEDLAQGSEARYQLVVNAPATSIQRSTAWRFTETKPGMLELLKGDRPVFRYNGAPVSSPNYKEIQIRDAYIHPAYSPSGALITGDFSPFHPHHRGYFLAYERTRSGELTPDFWNIHLGTGKIHADGLVQPIAGPVTARFSSRHRWEAIDKAAGTNRVVLLERWDVEVFDIPGSPYWLFDLTSSQQAVDRPMEVLPYRYGGMAYRGPEPFQKGPLDVLTSEGKHRKDGDQKPARWVDLTGPVADGSNTFAGSMIVDHPDNLHYPNVARIHPTTLPFFSYVPAYDLLVRIGTNAPTVFRYRIMIHDGHPDATLDDRIARDFAEPPSVSIE